MIGWIISIGLGALGLLAAFRSKGKQAESATENKLLLEAIDYAKRQNRKARKARASAAASFDAGGVRDDYKYLRKR